MKAERRMRREWAALRAAAKAGLHAAAAAMARDFVAKHPDCGPAWLALGKALTALADYAGARRAIDRAIALCPADKLFVPFTAMGEACWASGNAAGAVLWHQRAVEAAPDDAGPRILLGGVLAAAGDLAEAEAAFRAAVACPEGHRDEAYLNLGLVLRAQGRLDEARGAVLAAMATDPDYAPATKVLRDLDVAARFTSRASARVAKGVADVG